MRFVVHSHLHLFTYGKTTHIEMIFLVGQVSTKIMEDRNGWAGIGGHINPTTAVSSFYTSDI